MYLFYFGNTTLEVAIILSLYGRVYDSETKC